MTNTNFVSIIIPVYNSEITISELVERIKITLKKRVAYTFEILLINDGSLDSSYTVCKELTQKYSFVKLIDLSKNFGQHNAIIAGFSLSSGNYIICLDDDLQTPPEELWKLIDKLDEGYDVVYAKYIEKKHNIFKKVGSRINSFMLTIMLNKPKELSLSSYFAIKRFLLEEILKYDGPNPYIWGLILRSTNKIANIDVIHNKRKYGKTGYSIYKLLKLFYDGLIGFSILPLRLLFFMGIAFIIISILAILIIIIKKISDPSLPIGWSSIATLILFFSGIILMSIGLIGEYLGRIFLHTSKYTQYLIREKINFDK